MMIANWIHIVIVHFAVVGTPLLLYMVLVNRKVHMDAKPWKVTFTGLIVLAIITGISYLTGPETSDYTKQVLVSFPQEQVEDHALWGRITFVLQVIAGLIGIMGWASILQQEKPERRIASFLIVLLIINTLLIIYTAHMGGLIRRMDLL